MAENILDIRSAADFRQWLIKHHKTEKECWVCVKRGEKHNDNELWYIDAVYEAICFGWIDSTYGIIDGVRMQRFSRRTKRSSWTELNIARAGYLENMGLMTEEGRRALPEMYIEPVLDDTIMDMMKNEGIYDTFMGFPLLYRRIRISNLNAARKRSEKEYESAIDNFVKKTKEGKMYGNWNDYGRLSLSVIHLD